MRRLCPMLLAGVIAAGCASVDTADDTPDVVSYTAYDGRLASAGAVTADGLARLRGDGLERVVYLGDSSDTSALAGEDAIVEGLGMQFVQVPVRGAAPADADFELFAAVMRQSSGQHTLVHCGSNRRASAFTMLYRVLYEDVPLVEAKARMNEVWTPNETWTVFLRETLARNGTDPDCDGCDWTPAPPPE